MNETDIELKTQWNPLMLQTDNLQPAGSTAVLLDIPLHPNTVDAGLPEIIARALAVGLTECGIVAGRWFHSVTSIPTNAVAFEPQSRNPMQRAMERFFTRGPFRIVTTASPAVVTALLDQEWNVQHQALLVLDRDNPSSSDEALKALSVNRRWTEFSFPRPVKALIAPGVDGDFILIACPNEQCLRGVLGCLATSFRDAGFAFSVPN